MKTGDLVIWPEGPGDEPGLVLDTRAALGSTAAIPAGNGTEMRQGWPSGINPNGQAVQVMLPNLGNSAEWFHECELVKVS
jgi:hypothetical protein